MGWDYQPEIDGVSILDYATSFRVLSEYGLTTRRDVDFYQPGAHGVIHVADKLDDSGLLVLATRIRDTNPSGVVDHADGRPGHIVSNLAQLKRRFGRHDRQVTISRTLPHYGEVSIDVELVDQPQPGSDRFEVIWTFKAAKPYWKVATAVTTNPLTTGSFNPGGDGPVDDMVLTFTGNGSVVHANGDRVEIAGGSGTVVVDVGNRTVLSGSTDRQEWLVVANERWLHLEGGINNTLTVTGTVAMTHHPKVR